jgi:ribosome-associated translation inhibitor RaiA
MLIDIRAFGFSLTDAIWRHVESRVESALGPFAREVLKVTVRLENVSADPGVMDKRCSIVVALRRYPVQVAEGVATDLYAAVDDAAERIRGCVLRSIKRHIAMVRRSTYRPGALAKL